jgi:glucose-1-phosphate adenylyltransferase
MDYSKMVKAHKKAKAAATIAVIEVPWDEASRFGIMNTDENLNITEFEEKPVQATSNTISCGIYIIRRRQLVEMIEKASLENRYDFVKDVLIRYKDIKRIYAYKMTDYWKNISTIQDYFDTNMDFLKPDIRRYFFKTFPDIYSKVDDLPPAKYNVGVEVRNSLVASGSIINGTIENSVVFKKAFIGNNCTIRNSIILNDVYIGDNSYIENCIVESRSTIRANSVQKGDDGIKIVVEKNERYVI